MNLQYFSRTFCKFIFGENWWQKPHSTYNRESAHRQLEILVIDTSISLTLSYFFFFQMRHCFLKLPTMVTKRRVKSGDLTCPHPPPPSRHPSNRPRWGTISLMRGEAEEETAAATGRAVRHLVQEPNPPPMFWPPEIRLIPRTLVVNKGPLITPQPADKGTHNS